MRSYFSVRIPVDHNGYVLSEDGSEIIASGGDVSYRTYVEGIGDSLWRRAARVRADHDIADFFGRVGPLRGVDAARIYSLQEARDDFALLADLASRKWSLPAYSQLAAGVTLKLVGDGAQNAVHVMMPNLFSYLKVLIISELGTSRRSVESLRTCLRCDLPFTAGGGRGGSKRLDAKYCSGACAKAASRARRPECSGVATSAPR